MTTREQAAELRAQNVRAAADRPSERRSAPDKGGPAACRAALSVRAQATTRNSLSVVRIGGYASKTETPYEMWDMWGPYTEVVTRGAFSETLAASPLVEFTVNHGAGGGMAMASTRNDMLELVEDETGLDYNAYVDPTRSDVGDLVKAVERGDMAEASFKFRITSGVWSPDYTEYRINAVDLHRGDVSTVNFGASPTATAELRRDPAPAPVVDIAAAVARDRMLARLALELAEV